MKIIIPELLYTGGEFKKEYAVTVDGTKIRRIGSASELKKEAEGAEILELPHQVLVPGTVNAHNHCFQSLLRGIAADRPFLRVERPFPVSLFPAYDVGRHLHGSIVRVW